MKVEFKRVNQNPVSTKTKGRCDPVRTLRSSGGAKPMMEMNPTEQGIRQPADGDDNVAALLISIWHFWGNILMHL